MFTQFKIMIMIGAAVVLAAALGSAYWYYNWSQEEMQLLRENAVKLNFAVETQKATIKSIEKDIKQANKIATVVNKDYEIARGENVNLRKKLAKHNIAYLASRKPELVSKILTKASRNAERCFEILGGSELTKDEIAATKKSQANGECPSLANPNYIPRSK